MTITHIAPTSSNTPGLFDGAETDVAALCSQLTSRVYGPGEPIATRCTGADWVFVVMGGAVRLFHTGPDGREVTVGVLQRGGVFGIAALVGLEQEPIEACAVGQVRVCGGSARAFLAALSESPPLLGNLVTVLAHGALAAETLLETLASGGIRERLATHLVALVAKQPVPAITGTAEYRLLEKLPHVLLARQIGTSRETVTRLLCRFEDEGLIRRDGRFIVIRDLTRLETIAGCS